MTCAPWPAGSTRRCWPTRGSAPPCDAQAGRAPLPVEIEADGIGRYPRDAEAAAYFCILEALQNVAKYARASRATVALSCPDGHLEFTVTDDGDGESEVPVRAGQGDGGPGGPRVLRDVLQGLQDAEVHGGLGVPRVAPDAIGLDLDGKRSRPACACRAALSPWSASSGG